LLNPDDSQMMPSRVKFTIAQPRQQPLSIKNQLPTRKRVPKEEQPETKHVLPNFEKQYTAKDQFKEGDGIDLYLDWGRFLPDNSSMVRCYVRAVNSKLQPIGKGEKGMAAIEYSSGRHPFFGFKHEFRLPKFDPSALVIISFETIDLSTNKPAVVGYSFFPLFLDKDTKLPITDSGSLSSILHQGAYQMPVYS